MIVLSIADDEAIRQAVAAIQRGTLIVAPTDTVYGLMCSPFDSAAIERVYQAKQRPQTKALPVLIADADDVFKVARAMPSRARALAASFWPGALTMTLPKRDDLPPNLSHYETIAVRMPDHDFCRALIRAAGGVLAATSANRSGGHNATTIQQAIDHLGESVALYLDGGSTPGDVASTVVELHEDELVILREGVITRQMLEKIRP